MHQADVTAILDSCKGLVPREIPREPSGPPSRLLHVPTLTTLLARLSPLQRTTSYASYTTTASSAAASPRTSTPSNPSPVCPTRTSSRRMGRLPMPTASRASARLVGSTSSLRECGRERSCGVTRRVVAGWSSLILCSSGKDCRRGFSVP